MGDIGDFQIIYKPQDDDLSLLSGQFLQRSQQISLCAPPFMVLDRVATGAQISWLAREKMKKSPFTAAMLQINVAQDAE